jgi:DNA sulfur modification protein DndC
MDTATQDEFFLNEELAEVNAKIDDLVKRGALFVVNTSAGKDSHAMQIFLQRFVPKDQLVLIHAELRGADWPGLKEHIELYADGIPVHYCAHSTKTLLERVRERGQWPSPAMRWCTSDFKRGPITKVIRSLGHKLIVNCTGLRAEESATRAKHLPFTFNERDSKAGREWYEYLPIHHWTEKQVFDAIRDAGQEPLWVYAAGMRRASCCFCIYASESDLRTAARLTPEKYREYVQMERDTGHVMIMPTKKHGRRTLEEITGIDAGLGPPTTAFVPEHKVFELVAA